MRCATGTFCEIMVGSQATVNVSIVLTRHRWLRKRVYPWYQRGDGASLTFCPAPTSRSNATSLDFATGSPLRWTGADRLLGTYLKGWTAERERRAFDLGNHKTHLATLST